MEEDEVSFDTEPMVDILDDEDNDLLRLEQDEDAYEILGNLSDEEPQGFSGRHHLEGFSFPGDEKDWN